MVICGNTGGYGIGTCGVGYVCITDADNGAPGPGSCQSITVNFEAVSAK